MQRVYWRPQKISKAALFVIGLVAVGGTLLVEQFPTQHHHGDVQAKIVAAQLASRGMQAIHEARVQRGHDIDSRFDPTESGMIGLAMSAVTSLPGDLKAKQTSVNPNFASVAVELLQQAGVGEGDVVAVGCTGSLPALNTCLYAALQSLGAEPLIIHSAASSQFGANVPDMMWLDMEQVLYDEGIIAFRTHAATLGGFGDRARGMSPESQQLLSNSLERNGVPPILISSLERSIDLRMEAYRSESAGRTVKAYVNVGGGAASIHGEEGREAFGAGLSTALPTNSEAIDCVATRYARQGIPVVNLSNVATLAKAYGLPATPEEMPEVGVGSVFVTQQPSRLLAGLLLFGVLSMVRIYVWTDWWTRLQAKFNALNHGNQQTGVQLHQASQGAELMV